MKNWSSHQRFRPNFYLHRRKWNQLQEWSLVDPTETNGLSWTKHKKLDFHAGLVTSDSLLCRRKRSLSFGIPRCLRSILPSILEIKHLLRIHASSQTQFSVWGSLAGRIQEAWGRSWIDPATKAKFYSWYFFLLWTSDLSWYPLLYLNVYYIFCKVSFFRTQVIIDHSGVVISMMKEQGKSVTPLIVHCRRCRWAADGHGFESHSTLIFLSFDFTVA